MSRARDLFDRLLVEKETGIDRLIDERQSESLFLDFKQATHDGDVRRLHVSDLNNLAKAISGFGNSEGGVVVWGVDCRDIGQGDVAGPKFPITDPESYKSRLDGAVSKCTVPPHSGVTNEVIDSAQGGGFVVTYIPKYRSGPLQVVQGSRYYYMRAGSSFEHVSYGVLAGMFGVHPESVLTHSWTQINRGLRFEPQKAIGAVVIFELSIVLTNEGPTIARHLYANVKTWPPLGQSRIVVGLRTPNWNHNSVRQQTSAVSKDSFRLAPLAETVPLTLTFRLASPFGSRMLLKFSYGHASSPIKLAHQNLLGR